MPAGSRLIRIDQYQVFNTIFGEMALNKIDCYSGRSFVGYIAFHPRDHLPTSHVVQQHGSANYFFELYCDVDRYQGIIETLRYEKPVYVGLYWYDNNDFWYGYVSTSEEPVGEQEGAGVPQTT